VAVGIDHRDEQLLEIVPRDSRRSAAGEDRPHRRSATPTRMTIQQQRQRDSARQPSNFGLVEGPFDLPARSHRCQVEDRPEDGGDRNPVDLLHFVGQQARLAQHDRALLRTAGRVPTHFDALGLIGKNAPQPSRRAMTEHRSWAAGEERRHPSAIRSGQRMPYRVDAPILGPKETPFDPLRHRVSTDSEREQLPSGHHPVLPPRQVGDRAVRR
jgi:hypothetical protein